MVTSICTCFCLLVISRIVDCTSTRDEFLQEKIVIIGAGAAGISAASKLLEYGYTNIVVLEADNRIGGRIQTEYYDGDHKKYLELGSQLILGETGNILYELSKKAGIIGTKFDELDALYVKASGENIPAEKILSIWFSYYDITSTFGNETKLVSDLFKQSVENLNTSDLDKDTTLQLLRLIMESITPFTDWEDEIGVGLRSYEHIPGSTGIGLTKGVISVLHMLMNSFPGNELSPIWQEIIHLNSKVERIYWNQAKPIVQYTKSTNPHTLLDIEAEHIIVTIPLGVLKHEHKTLFVPPLPERKVNAVRSLTVGTVNKIFLTYEHPWWPDNHIFFILWTDAEKENLKKSDKWLSNVLIFTIEEYYPATITAWVVEKDTVTTEIYPDVEVYAKLANFVQQVFANQGWNITDPISTKRTRWQYNPLSRGTNSYRGVKSFNTHITSADLRESLKNDNGKETVLFAGEATHDKYYSALHGAIESGYTAANNINELHKLV